MIKTMKGGMMILPPNPANCQVCAQKHDPALPHNPHSMYWGVVFQDEHGRAPTWKDAMAHCSDEVKTAWTEALKEKGIIVEQ